MKAKNPKEMAIAKLVAVNTGLSPKNVQRTYMHNENGKDKAKMLNVLILGSLCAESELTEDEVKKGIVLVKAIRE